MNYVETLEYIHSVNWCFCKPGLARISELCNALGNPERELRFIHVAGTNGKGSFCSMMSSILMAQGYKVGLYTSPYVTVFNERMRINGENISNEELIELTEKIRPIADSMLDKPTEFELITAIAFEYFRRNKCDIVVLEAGMGGRLDSTNVIESSLLSVITGIALDHTAYLGDTVEKIAAEKAGIIKPRCPVIFGGEDTAAEKVIKCKANQLSSDFYKVDYSDLKVRSITLDGTLLDFRSWISVDLALLGSYQPKNAALVLTAVEVLRENGVVISDDAVFDGLKGARWGARFELLSKDPIIIFDGAHNPQGIAAAVDSIKTYFGDNKVYLLTGVLKDKDYECIAHDLFSIASKAFTLTPDSPRALDSNEYAKVLMRAGIDAIAFDSIMEAFTTAKNEAAEAGIPLVCLGSLYVYSSLIKFL